MFQLAPELAASAADIAVSILMACPGVVLEIGVLVAMKLYAISVSLSVLTLLFFRPSATITVRIVLAAAPALPVVKDF